MRYTVIIDSNERDDPFSVVRDDIVEVLRSGNFEVESVAERFVP